MKTINTHIHYYHLDISKPAQAEAYAALVAELESTPGRGRWLNVFPTGKEDRAGPNGSQEQIVLDTGHLFNNQWNSDKGRVFDWYEAVTPNKDIRRGHYLDITPSMVKARQARLCCGYCGGQIDTLHWPHNKIRPEYHTDCLGSEYLKESELKLLKLETADFDGTRPPLAKEGLEQLLPRYTEAQAHMRAAKAVKIREMAIAKADKAIQHARRERDGFLWLLDNDVNTENCIYYSKDSGVFSFGWRTALSEGVAAEIDRILKKGHFPFEYELKLEDKGTTQRRKAA